VTHLPEADYVDSVHRATLALRAGEAQKAVLSRYQAYDVDYDPVELFAAYCLTQSFVDAFLVCFDDVVAVVASPEMLLSVTEHTLLTNPLAGTRKRGATVEEDERLRQELRADRKEMAEHVFSVTTMLDELTPVCAPGTLAVTRLLDVALQQKVQHLSSVIAGRLAEGVGALDALWALFPSVTVTGLPKSAALPLVRRLEEHPRGIYAGTLGWAAGRGDCRFSLAIRGIFRYGERSFLQAGAGIMPESRPDAELAETAHKLRAMEDALAGVIGETACPHVLR
jgi:anthranilate/para-aminobenzoate synthase component I